MPRVLDPHILLMSSIGLGGPVPTHIAGTTADDIARVAAAGPRDPVEEFSRMVRHGEFTDVGHLERLQNLLGHGSVQAVRQLEAAPSATQALADAIRGAQAVDGAPLRFGGPHVLRYASVWRLQADPVWNSPDRLAEQVQRSLGTPVDQWNQDSWRRLRAAIDADVGGTLPGPRTLPGSPSFTELLSRRIDKGLASPELDAYLTAWRTALDVPDPAQRADELARLFTGDPADLAAGDWQRVAHLLASDPANSMGGPRALGGPTLFHLATQAAADGLDIEATRLARRYAAAWQVHLVESAAPWTLRTDLRQLASRAPTSLTDAELRRLQAILDSAGRQSLSRLADTRDVLALAKGVEGELAARVRTVIASDALQGAPPVAGSFAMRSLAAGLGGAATHRPALDRLALVDLVLHDQSVATTPSVLPALEVARGALDELALPPEAQDLVAEARVLLDRNIARVRGEYRDDPKTAYAGHADYAEIGIARQHLQALAHLAGAGE